MKAVLFDFDGTLADTLPICFEAFQTVFKVFDRRDISTKEIKAMFGPSETGIIKQHLFHEDKEKAINLYYDIYARKHAGLVEQNKEIVNLLQTIQKEKMKLAIVTGKARRSLDISLKALQLNGLFDLMITSDDVDQSKPDPEGINKALSLLGVDKEEALFVGDSDADMQAGKAAGVGTIGVQWLSTYQAEEFNIQPDYFYDCVRDFISLIKNGKLSSRSCI